MLKSSALLDQRGYGNLTATEDGEAGNAVIGDILVDEGDHVKLGQVVGHLAPEQFTADVRTASSGISLARAAIRRLDAEGRRATTTLAFAEIEDRRMKSLAVAGTVPARDLDLAVQQLALAQAEVERVRASRDEARRGIAVASGTADARAVTAARAALVSPFDGIVIRRLRDPGATVTVGTTVLRVIATDALWSRLWIDETALPDLREGQPARIRLGAEGNVTVSGTVDRIGRESDRQTHELLIVSCSRTYRSGSRSGSVPMPGSRSTGGRTSCACRCRSSVTALTAPTAWWTGVDELRASR